MSLARGPRPNEPVKEGDRVYLGVIVERALPGSFHVRLEGTELVLRVPTVYRRRPGQGIMDTVEANCANGKCGSEW